MVSACRGDLAAVLRTPRCSRRVARTTRTSWSGGASGGRPRRRLAAVCRELGGVPRKVVDGVVRLAELRRRQGRLDQAEALLAEAEGHRLALLVRAALRLDREDAAGARPRRRSDSCAGSGTGDRFERVPALELLVRARLGLGEQRDTEAASDELERIAAEGGTRRCAPPRSSRAAASTPRRRPSMRALRSRTRSTCSSPVARLRGGAGAASSSRGCCAGSAAVLTRTSSAPAARLAFAGLERRLRASSVRC